jgi:hypothetical protein
MCVARTDDRPTSRSYTCEIRLALPFSLARNAALTATDYVYDQADLYDKEFSYRDIETETSFLNDVYAPFSSSNRAPRSVLETASGSGRHALAFAHALTNQGECILSEHTATSMSAPSFDQAKPTCRAGE